MPLRSGAMQAVYHALRKPAQSASHAAMQPLSGPAASQPLHHSSVLAGGGRPGGGGTTATLRRAARAAAKPAFVVVVALWWPLAMGCAPFDRSVAGELRGLLEWRTAAADMPQQWPV